MAKKIKKKEALTRYEADKQSKYLAGELAEELTATGQDSEEKAAKWVIEKGEEDRKEEDEKTAQALDILDSSKKKIFTYRDALVKEMKRRMVENFALLPENYIWYPVKDRKQGIVLYFKDAEGHWYARGMNPCGLPMYDLNCIEQLVQKALDSMDELERRKNPEPQTILTP